MDEGTTSASEGVRYISSDKQCEHATADGRPQRDYPIEGRPGLALRVTAGGTKTWTYRYRRVSDGKMRRTTLGRYPSVTYKEARASANNLANDVSGGVDPQQAKRDRRQGESFEALAEQWLSFKARQGRAASYVGRSQYRLSRLPKWFREMKANDLKRLNVTNCLEEIAKRGANTETNRYQALISAVLGWAVREGLIDDNASRDVQRRFDEEPRDRVLSDSEVRTFYGGIDSMSGEEGSHIAMKLCFVLGQRPKEIVELQQDNLALNAPHPTATILKGSSKNRTTHVLPLPKLAVALLRRAVEIAGDSKWVFPSPTGATHIDPHALSEIVKRSRTPGTGKPKAGGRRTDDLFGMKDVQLYDSKKTVATFLGNAGHPDQFIGLLFNHLTAKSGSVTGRHYNHATYMNTKRQLVEEWARHLESVLGIKREGDISSAAQVAATMAGA